MPSAQSTAAPASVLDDALAPNLFALTDEQILEIEPEAQDVEVSAATSAPAAESQPAAATTPDADASAAPPGPFAAPEEVRALAELYPGGLSQAKTAAERARTLDEIDAAYFGAASGTPEQTSSARAQLAQRMLREDPVTFREMVFAGLRALEEAGKSSSAVPSGNGVGAGASSVVAQQAAPLQGASAPAAGARAAESQAAYAAFERAANEELERSVGAAIGRTIAQALPNLSREEGANSAGARGRVSGFALANSDSTTSSLRERLASSVRQDVEAALKGDRQLGEQIAKILAAKRFDDATRAQVVRLIGDRARQLVPGAARRVINEWTSTTLAAHGARRERDATASSKREVPPAASTSSAAPSNQALAARQSSGTGKPRSIDYRKLSDDQILDL